MRDAAKIASQRLDTATRSEQPGNTTFAHERVAKAMMFQLILELVMCSIVTLETMAVALAARLTFVGSQGAEQVRIGSCDGQTSRAAAESVGDAILEPARGGVSKVASCA